MGRLWFSEEWLQPYRNHRNLGSRSPGEDANDLYDDLVQKLSSSSAAARGMLTSPEVVTTLRVCLNVNAASRCTVHELNTMLSLPEASIEEMGRNRPRPASIGIMRDQAVTGMHGMSPITQTLYSTSFPSPPSSPQVRGRCCVACCVQT